MQLTKEGLEKGMKEAITRGSGAALARSQGMEEQVVVKQLI